MEPEQKNMAEAGGVVDISVLLDRLAADRPDGPALTVDDRTITFAELRRLSLQAASRLTDIGVTFGTTVALPMHNSFEQTAFFFGAWRLGATPLALSPHFPDAELAKVMEVAGTGLLVREGQDLAGAPLWEGVARTAPRLKAQTSGGSTGVPKVLVDSEPAKINLGSNFLRWGWSEGPALFVPGPTYHSGPMNHLIEGLARGLHVITMRRFDAAGAAALITRHRPHWALFVPTMMNRILKLPPDALEHADFSSLKYVWHSAATCPAWLKQQWIDLVGPEAVWEIFGGSEGVATTIINGVEWLEHRGSVGRAMGGEIAIFDEDGNPVPNGEVGEIYMRNLAVPRRFVTTTEVKRRTVGDWESFGDLGWLDDEGYLFLADRRVDMINSGGQNIYPGEVEAAIQSYPGVGDAVVFGQPDEDLGEVVCAFVWLENGEPDKDRLLAHLADQILRYKIPRRLAFVDAPIRNDAGKVRRSELVLAE
jgi:bile acid-coenzyme A ligase